VQVAQSWHRLPSDSARLAFLGVASYWTLTCCFSRLYMGVHSPLDVVSVACVWGVGL
jgi:membrane-associated phospholipid phosphatase